MNTMTLLNLFTFDTMKGKATKNLFYVVATLIFSFHFLQSFASEEITSVGRVDNKQIYKIGDVFVTVSPGDMLGDCLVTEKGLRCGGQNITEEVNYLSQISETLVNKVNDVRELSEDISFLRQQLANRESAVKYLNDEIEQNKSFSADLSKQLAAANAKILEGNEELEYTKRSNARLSLRSEKLANEANELKGRIAGIEKQLQEKDALLDQGRTEADKRLVDQIASLTLQNKNYELQIQQLTDQSKSFSEGLNGTLSEENRGLQNKVDQMRENYETKIASLDNQNRSYQSQIADLKKQNEELNSYVNAANADINFYKSQLSESQSELAKTKNLAAVDRQRIDETKLNLQVSELRSLVDSLRESVRIKTMQLSQLQSEFSKGNTFSRQAPRTQ